MEQEKRELRQIHLYALLDDLLREARRLWALALVLVVLCAGVLTAVHYVRYTPEYQAHASFTVRVAESNGYNAQTARQMARTFPNILTSDVLGQRVQDHLGLADMPRVTVEVTAGSNIFTLRVTDTDPYRAYDVLNAIIAYYPEIAEFVVGPTVLYLLDESGVQTQPYDPFSPMTYVQQGALIGLAVWAVLVALLALNKSTIHNGEELRSALNLGCLSQLPAVRVSKGTSPVAHKDVSHQGFCESVELLRLRVEKQMQERDMKVLAVSGAIPGEGKTTVAVNLAVSLARKGSRVLLVDWNPGNPSVARALKMKDQNGLAEYLNGGLAVRDVIKPTEFEGLFVILGGSGPKEGHLELLDGEQARDLIHAARTGYDYVILDAPPCSILMDGAELADCALMVVRQDYAAQDQLLDGVQDLSEGGLPILGCVINGFQSAMGHACG